MLTPYLNIQYLKGDVVDLPTPSLSVAGFRKGCYAWVKIVLSPVLVSASTLFYFGSWKLCCIFSWESQHQQQCQQHLGQP